MKAQSKGIIYLSNIVRYCIIDRIINYQFMNIFITLWILKGLDVQTKFSRNPDLIWQKFLPKQTIAFIFMLFSCCFVSALSIK